nr:hypothetical protein [Tanacetum cinerariifolium]
QIDLLKCQEAENCHEKAHHTYCREYPPDSLRIGTRFSTLDFMNSSDYVARIGSRCSSPIPRELSGSLVAKMGVIAMLQSSSSSSL